MLNIQNALKHWDIAQTFSTCSDQGLINQTWLIGTPPQGVLQWVNPIFDPNIHYDIEHITQHLANKNIATPRLKKTNSGALFLKDPEQGSWRVWSYLPGKTHHRVHSARIAYSAGKCVGAFHRAIADLQYEFKACLRDAHNTPLKINALKEAIDECTNHPLYDEASALGEQIIQAWTQWRGSLDEPLRICHGDLKISNLHFNQSDEAYALLDLDTFAPLSLSVELGDAWRSWCNPAGEDDPSKVQFDLEIFEASLKGWCERRPSLKDKEKDNLDMGIERICLELSARFCTDALKNSYFKEDRSRFPEIGRHNLHRALGQFKLAQSVKAQERERKRILAKVLNASMCKETL